MSQGERKIRVLGVQRELTDVVGKQSNSAYQVGKDISILLDEVLNNDISAVFVYGDFGSGFSDVDLYSLSVVFRKNVSVLALTICGVDIGDETMSLLCDSLLHSNVQYIDLTNTPLDEEAGRSLAALAQNNHNIRTVIVEETLISEEAMDEIDMACQFNDVGFELPKTIALPDRKRLCVPHQFSSCPNGDYCVYAHVDGAAEESQIRDWSELLKHEEPQAGASWRDTDSSPKKAFTLNRDRISKQRNEGDRVGNGRRVADSKLLFGCAFAGIVATCTCILLWRRSQK